MAEEEIMEINTMCGHGMVSVGRVEDVLKRFAREE